MRPLDTSPEAWAFQQAVLARLTPGERLHVALELSEAVRSMQMSGLRARHPELGPAEAMRVLIAEQYGVFLPETT